MGTPPPDHLPLAPSQFAQLRRYAPVDYFQWATKPASRSDYEQYIAVFWDSGYPSQMDRAIAQARMADIYATPVKARVMGYPDAGKTQPLNKPKAVPPPRPTPDLNIMRTFGEVAHRDDTRPLWQRVWQTLWDAVHGEAN